MKPTFHIEQIALRLPAAGPTRERAMALLRAMGWTDWTEDVVCASGTVGRDAAVNRAKLQFNYQASPPPGVRLELELLDYTHGSHWLDQRHAPTSMTGIYSMHTCVTHLGCHCTEAELCEWRKLMEEHGIRVAQEVHTTEHTNAHVLSMGRTYHYCIFNTRHLLGVDLKFIVRVGADQ